ncbi:MAG: TonB-dependent receptor [Bacteroidales bacterium]|jgi:TonB-linked SusC/RagA family outer membrane protein|nr:TonB-dependent receptor [Bacteroidales bacterium]
MKKKILVVLCALLYAGTALLAQQKSFVVSGTVYDETGSTMPGVTIYLKDKIGIGTASDTDGKFSIKTSRGDVIIFSFVGYEPVEYLALEGKTDLRIDITNASQQLEEVVVVGMGQQRKISSLAAVSTVAVKDLQMPVASVANLLGGKVAGVISMQTSGEPGKNISEFWVRGIGTFGASGGALVLIDGLEGDINSIDPADIESFSVLKDASATAVYGVRGANGVVLITTKRGEAGKLNITARANYSLSQLRRMPEYLRAYDYALLANEAQVLRGGSPDYRNIELDIIQNGLDPDIFPDVSWQDEIMRNTSFEQTYYVSARGGGEMARYFLSLGGSNESAAYKQDKSSIYSSNVGYNTFNYRTNLDLSLSKSTTVYFGVDGFLSIRTEPGMANSDYLWYAQSQINPLLLPTTYSNGYFPSAGAAATSSPYVMINHTGQASNRTYKGKVTLSLSQDFSFLLDGLNFKIQGAYDDQNFFNERRYVQPALYQAVQRNTNGDLVTTKTMEAVPAQYTSGRNMFRKYHLESTVNYDKVLGTDHRVSGLLYYYLSDQKHTENATGSMNAIPVRYQGASGRLTYSYQDTYMMDVNFGYTGSENFQPGRQYGFFPSIALGWVPTSYRQMKDIAPWLNFFKIRASYGSVGNDRLATSTRFPYMTMVSLANRSVMNGSAVETFMETRIGADNLEWEKALKADIGIEGRLFNDKLSFVVDIFNDQRNGIFQQRVQVPAYVGLIQMPFGNVGRMRSFGADGNASYTHELNKDMSVTVRGNFTYSRNEVQNWEEQYLDYDYLSHSGYPHNAIRGYKAMGLFKDPDDVAYSPAQPWGTVMPGDIKYEDVNGDGKISSDDMIPLSYNTYPRLMYGMGGEFRYKNLTVGILFKGTGRTDFYHVGQSVTQGGSTYQNGMGYVPFYEGASGNVLSIAADPANRWIPRDYALANNIDPALAENPNARFPRLQYGYNSNNSQLSSFWHNDARYLRLQEVTVNYNLKTNALRKIGVASIDLQLVGNNLYVWDKVKIFDPEQAQFNGRVYPIPSVYSLQIYIYL